MKWAERRCAEALAIIRPVMRQHKIRTSEWPGCGFNPPEPAPAAAPAPAGGLVERVTAAVNRTVICSQERNGIARAAIREMATVGYSANPFNPVSEQAKHHGWLAAFAWLEQKANQ
jgi:hypothetical protein